MITYILLPIFILTALHFVFMIQYNILEDKPLLEGTKVDAVVAGIVTAISLLTCLFILI